jgi:hypothetical protein
MTISSLISNMPGAISDRQFPAITQLHRLEGRPRTRKFDDALKAEVRDALWMLCRQWQMGEFEGDDAASPFFAKMNFQATPLTKYQARGQATEAFDSETPLEALFERRPVPLVRKDHPIALDIRLLLGRHWLKLLSDFPDYAAQFLKAYAVATPPTDDPDTRAHPEVSQAFDAVAGRRMDGGALYLYLLANPGHQVYDGLDVAELDKPVLEERAKQFVAWYQRLLYQPLPPENQAWDPAYLEYQGACSAPTADSEKVFVAAQYYEGRLDWYNFDVDGASSGLSQPADTPPPATTNTVIPTPVRFAGMPNTRWWAFEDGKTNFGDVTASTTDLAKLLFLEFGLVYANDWFLIPCTVPGGSIANVRGLVVTNVFGEYLWIDPAGSGDDSQWQRWSMFTCDRVGSTQGDVDHTLLVLPTAPSQLESAPLEEVLLIRDESANMVWGIEKAVWLPDGSARPGTEVATETRAFLERELGAGLPVLNVTYHASIRYRAMNSVPENWIPFIPAHVTGSSREVQLQRAAMPRFFEGNLDPDTLSDLPREQRLVAPQTGLLREGLEAVQPTSYFIHEEEVPRSGVRITLTFQRARWKNGRVVLWLGLRKEAGRGEASSGLAFDEIVDVPAQIS